MRSIKQMQVHIQIKGDSHDFLRELAGNHYIIFPGDYFEAWVFLARWFRINVH